MDNHSNLKPEIFILQKKLREIELLNKEINNKVDAKG